MDDDFQLSAYDYDLPPERIAQQPAVRRDQSRLMVLDVGSDALQHRRFSEITDLLRPGDLLVVNNTRVFPARLLGRKDTGGRVEMLLLHYPGETAPCPDNADWRESRVLTLVRSSKRPRPGARLLFGDRLQAVVEELCEDGKVGVRLRYRPGEGEDLETLLSRHGQMPLPPYIRRPEGCTGEDRDRYQTRYARETGSVAAPTAGLHFSDTLLERIRQQGIATASVTLHVGYGTFAPVRTKDIRQYAIHSEYVHVGREAADTINRTRASGNRVWAVGTTTVRTLEFAADANGRVRPVRDFCDMFIYPGHRFRVVDNLVTNFHLPRSSLLFLVSALAGRNRILASYQEAIRLGYRFFSYGDAMAIITRK